MQCFIFIKNFKDLITDYYQNNSSTSFTCLPTYPTIKTKPTKKLQNHKQQHLRIAHFYAIISIDLNNSFILQTSFEIEIILHFDYFIDKLNDSTCLLRSFYKTKPTSYQTIHFLKRTYVNESDSNSTEFACFSTTTPPYFIYHHFQPIYLIDHLNKRFFYTTSSRKQRNVEFFKQFKTNKTFNFFSNLL